MIPILEPTPENIRASAEALRNGGLVGMPTETVYGLAGNALDARALARIFEVKQRPFFDPLIVHVGERGDVAALCRDVPADARALMDRFWPGPLTLVLPKTPLVPDLATAGLETVAVRMPEHPVARALLRAAGIPLAAPSANPFGALSPTEAGHVAAAFTGGITGVLDGGPCAIGVESTVVGWEQGQPVLLRAGGVAAEALEEALGRPLAAAAPAAEGAQASPGALPWHYAPRTPLRLLAPGSARDARTPGRRSGLLWFGSAPLPDAPGGFDRVENLSAGGDVREAAANLFAALHRLDDAGLEEICAVMVPEAGLGRAINDRLRKAAAAPRMGSKKMEIEKRR
jgi:L-threonylcarbamoyladenylate synthase